VYGTVFAEIIDARPGRLRLEYSRRPSDAVPWDVATFGQDDELRLALR
jgi:hypothetical protein